MIIYTYGLMVYEWPYEYHWYLTSSNSLLLDEFVKMFRTIVLAILFVEILIPLILAVVGSIFDSDELNIWCIVFAIAIIVIIVILL